jgi:endonuclease G
MNNGFSLFKLCAAIVFIIIAFLLVMERSHFNKAAEVTGMEDVIEQTKKDLIDATHTFKLNEKKYETHFEDVFKREYSAYTLYISCLHRGPLYGFMTLGKDLDNRPRKDKFSVDNLVPAKCRQTSTSSYSQQYHRGHLFAANHFDNDDNQMWESFYMSNIVPQHQVSNIGAWKRTEVITECYREHHAIYLAAGVLYGTDQSDDVFVQSHGVVTPTAMWKYIQLDSDKYSAWIIPNNEQAVKDKLPSFEVSIEDLMRTANIKIIPDATRVHRVQLHVFKGCHTS